MQSQGVVTNAPLPLPPARAGVLIDLCRSLRVLGHLLLVRRGRHGGRQALRSDRRSRLHRKGCLFLLVVAGAGAGAVVVVIVVAFSWS